MSQEIENILPDDEVSQAISAMEEAEGDIFDEEEEQLYMGDRPLDETEKVKRVSDIRLYFATFRFAFGRVKFILTGLLLVFLYFSLIGLLNTVAPVMMDKIGWLVRLLNTLAFSYLFGFVAGWNKRTRLLGQIGIIYNAVMRGTVPKHPYKAGLKMAQDRFHGVGVGKVVKDTLLFLIRAVFKRNRKKGELKKQILLLIQEIISLLMLMFADLFAKLGCCIVAYSYFNDGTDINIRSTIKAGRRYFKHILGVICHSLLNFFAWLAAMSLLAAPGAFGLHMLVKDTSFEWVFLKAILRWQSVTDVQAARILFYMILLVTVAAAIMTLLTGPFETIRMVRFYVRCLQRDGEGADEDLDATLSRMKNSLFETVRTHVFSRRQKTVPGTPEATAPEQSLDGETETDASFDGEESGASQTASGDAEEENTADTADIGG